MELYRGYDEANTNCTDLLSHADSTEITEIGSPVAQNFKKISFKIYLKLGCL